ncbi:hypothetical protein [Paraburkholderia aromaticivorans]|uniref:hypothetical protein n=1 Tax=Paraburkholderia aromaticivorans TaxID=2026199 RepID=UPI001455DE3C|nr:hypothetical protein [Paraburkholderia aromaticivorans]
MSVQRTLEHAYHALATRGAVRIAGYSAVSTASTAQQLSTGERFLQALWVIQATQVALDAIGNAFVIATYDGHGEARQAAIDILTAHLMTAKANPDLLRAVIERELVIGGSLLQIDGPYREATWRFAVIGVAAC